MSREPSFDELRDWCKEHWGLRLERAAGFESARTLKPYKTGFMLIGDFPGGRYGCRWFPSIRRVATVTKFEKKGSS